MLKFIDKDFLNGSQLSQFVTWGFRDSSKTDTASKLEQKYTNIQSGLYSSNLALYYYVKWVQNCSKDDILLRQKKWSWVGPKKI